METQGSCALGDGERLLERVRHLATESFGEEEGENSGDECDSSEDDGGEGLPHRELSMQRKYPAKLYTWCFHRNV